MKSKQIMILIRMHQNPFTLRYKSFIQCQSKWFIK